MFGDADEYGFSMEQWLADEDARIERTRTEWKNSGISFSTAMECGDFLIQQGFTCCDGGFEKLDELDGDRVFASYVLTKGKCFLRFCVL